MSRRGIAATLVFHELLGKAWIRVSREGTRVRVALATRAPATLILGLCLVVSSCTGSTNQGPPPAGASAAGAGSISLAAPDLDAFRLSEAALRKAGRDQAALVKLGPGALELATSMDRTASFLLAQVPARLKALAPPGQGSTARSALSTSGGRLAAPFVGLPPPGAPVFGTFAMTVIAFSTFVSDLSAPSSSAPAEKCPCTKSETFEPTKDEVTIEGNKGTILTTLSAIATINGSRISLDLKMKVEGEVRDAKTGAILFKIANEATGHAEGDVCPDASGTARASMAFSGRETHFDSSGAPVGSGVTEGFGGELRIRADEQAKLSGVELTPTGAFGEPLMRVAGQIVAPAFEHAWRSGLCIAVLFSPEGGDVETDSVTTVTVKAMNRTEGKELDKPLDVSFSGVKAIDPPPSRQKAPVSLRYTAGPKDGDRGTITAESTSNRGIGKKSVTFIVGGGWTIRSEGTFSEVIVAAVGNPGTHATVSLNAIRIKVGNDNTLTGSGTITIKGTYGLAIAEFSCSAPIDTTLPATVTGVLGSIPAGTTSDGSRPQEIPVLKLTIHVATPSPTDDRISMSCTDAPTFSLPYPGIGYRYALTLGELEIFALDGARKNFDRSVHGNPEYHATANVTLVMGTP